MSQGLLASTCLTPDDAANIPHNFDDALAGTNNPVGWAHVAAHLDRFAQIVQGRVVISLTATVRAAEEAVGCLFAAVITAKRENIEYGFQGLFSEAKGRSFGAKLINWAMEKASIDIAEDLKVAWGSLHQQMSSTMEMLLRQLEPSLPTSSPPPEPSSVAEYIREHGGMGKMHMTYMNYRRTEKDTEKAKREADQRRGAEQRRLEAAQAAGFKTPDEHEAAVLAEAERERHALLRSKFEILKQRLVRNGTLVTNLTPAPAGRLLITANDDKQYLISEDDEFSLLSCAAAVI